MAAQAASPDPAASRPRRIVAPAAVGARELRGRRSGRRSGCTASSRRSSRRSRSAPRRGGCAGGRTGPAIPAGETTIQASRANGSSSTATRTFMPGTIPEASSTYSGARPGLCQLVVEPALGRVAEGGEADLEPLVLAVRAEARAADADPAGDVARAADRGGSVEHADRGRDARAPWSGCRARRRSSPSGRRAQRARGPRRRGPRPPRAGRCERGSPARGSGALRGAPIPRFSDLTLMSRSRRGSGHVGGPVAVERRVEAALRASARRACPARRPGRARARRSGRRRGSWRGGARSRRRSGPRAASAAPARSCARCRCRRTRSPRRGSGCAGRRAARARARRAGAGRARGGVPRSCSCGLVAVLEPEDEVVRADRLGRAHDVLRRARRAGRRRCCRATVPAKRKPSCGTIPSWRRSEACVTSRRSWPSIVIRPSRGS